MISRTLNTIVGAVIFFGAMIGESSQAQDLNSLIDAAFANAECLQNYDVSFRQSIVVDLPKEQKARDAVIAKRGVNNPDNSDEEVNLCRLVVDKESTSNPKKIYFVRQTQLLAEGKVIREYLDFASWSNGESAGGTTQNPQGNIGRGKESLSHFCENLGIPCLDTSGTDFGPPRFKEYWDDHSVFWEAVKDGSSGLSLKRLRNGTLRAEGDNRWSHVVCDIDPVTSLRVYSSAIPIDQNTGEMIKDKKGSSRITWESCRNVYRLRSLINQNDTLHNLKNNEVIEFKWHQFNEENFVFPTEVLVDITREKSTQFLIDGQSEFSVGP